MTESQHYEALLSYVITSSDMDTPKDAEGVSGRELGTGRIQKFAGEAFRRPCETTKTIESCDGVKTAAWRSSTQWRKWLEKGMQ